MFLNSHLQLKQPSSPSFWAGLCSLGCSHNGKHEQSLSRARQRGHVCAPVPSNHWHDNLMHSIIHSIGLQRVRCSWCVARSSTRVVCGLLSLLMVDWVIQDHGCSLLSWVFSRFVSPVSALHGFDSRGTAWTLKQGSQADRSSEQTAGAHTTDPSFPLSFMSWSKDEG